MYKIYFTPNSKQDLEDIFYFTNNQKVLNNILISIGNLAFFPFLGKDIGGKLREFVVTKYKFRVVYSIKKIL